MGPKMSWLWIMRSAFLLGTKEEVRSQLWVTSTWDMLQLVAGQEPGICELPGPPGEVTGQLCHRRLSDCITCDGGASELRSP